MFWKPGSIYTALKLAVNKCDILYLGSFIIAPQNWWICTFAAKDAATEAAIRAATEGDKKES